MAGLIWRFVNHNNAQSQVIIKCAQRFDLFFQLTAAWFEIDETVERRPFVAVDGDMNEKRRPFYLIGPP